MQKDKKTDRPDGVFGGKIIFFQTCGNVDLGKNENLFWVFEIKKKKMQINGFFFAKQKLLISGWIGGWMAKFLLYVINS